MNDPIVQVTEWSPQGNDDSVRSTVLIIGLGNPILGDDGIGWRVVEEFEKHQKSRNPLEPRETYILSGLNSLKIEIDYLSVGGLALMERIMGYQQVILVDAITTDSVPTGTVMIMGIDDLPDRSLGHLSSAHDTTFKNALRVGTTMGAKMPEKITIVGIETNQVYNFSDELSFAIQQSIPDAVNKIMELLK